jgi:hypothetical protein
MQGVIDSSETLDVCIVGSGPAGLATALALGPTGCRVGLLESGGPHSSDGDQLLNDGDHEGVAYDGLIRTRRRQIGGTVNLWNVPIRNKLGAKFVPLSSRDMVDWPIGRDELDPYYIEAQTLCGLGPFRYDADYWATPGCTPFDLDGTGLTSAVYQFGAADQFTRILAKRLLRFESVTLVPNVTVVGLLGKPGARRLLGVRAVDANGQSIDVKAQTVVLACGAVENARLLMLAGLESTWLGRGFMEHARDFSLVLAPDSPRLFGEASFYDQRAATGGVPVGGRLALTDEALDSLALPNAAMTLVPRRRAGDRRGMLGRIRRSIARAVGPPESRYGWSRVRRPADVFDAFNIVLNLEQRPHPWNRVELSGRRDRFGNPLPRLVLTWTPQEQASLEQLRRLLGDWFRAAKLGRLLITNGHRPDMNAHHHAGTTRMGTSADDGVVDVQGRVFGWDNLYVTGASVFPSAGFANPTLTIVALALRLARSLSASPQ